MDKDAILFFHNFRFVDMFRKSRRHLRKSLSRARSEDVSETPSIFMSGRPIPSMPLLPPPTLAVSPPHLSSITGAMGSTSKKLESVTKSEESSTNKEKIREWIVQQVSIVTIDVGIKIMLSYY